MTYPLPGTIGEGDPRIPALPALTSAQVAAAPTQANFNALQTDVAAIHATLAGLLAELRPRGTRHSIARDARSVRHHYDVGNEFFALMLDGTMTTVRVIPLGS